VTRRVISPADRREASVDRELAARELATVRRYLRRPDLTPAQQRAALARQEELSLAIDDLTALLSADSPRSSARWPHDAYTSPAAIQRLRAAGAELTSVRADLEADRRRAEAMHRLHALEGSARRRMWAAALRAPDDELREMAPGLCREMEAAPWPAE
jgi:hypothetical protein